jgi:hypothetical protein
LVGTNRTGIDRNGSTKTGGRLRIRLLNNRQLFNQQEEPAAVAIDEEHSKINDASSERKRSYWFSESFSGKTVLPQSIRNDGTKDIVLP